MAAALPSPQGCGFGQFRGTSAAWRCFAQPAQHPLRRTAPNYAACQAYDYRDRNTSKNVQRSGLIAYVPSKLVKDCSVKELELTVRYIAACRTLNENQGNPRRLNMSFGMKMAASGRLVAPVGGPPSHVR